MGIWISGFFGSGKSHFLKILSYLIENKEVNGKKAVDFFAEKIGDPMLLGEMRRAAQPDTDVILFNIDSKSDADSKVKKDAIVKVFMKVFNERLGFCATIPWIAEMERQLINRGNYQAFQETFAEITKGNWMNLRGNAYFDRDHIIAALTKTAGMSEESATQWFDNAENNYSINIESFAKLVWDYCSETKRRVVFMVDEMGQYIGESSDLMLNLQTVAENLEFIANALGMNSTETVLERIRKYFLNEFFKDHLQVYKNRPIYWLFTSGKEKAFNVLIYMHRYDKSTIGRIRTDYLHELQGKMELERRQLAQILNGDAVGADKRAAGRG